MQQAINAMLSAPALQQFLQDVERSAAEPAFGFCKPAAVRAFFFDVDFDIDKRRSVALMLDAAANLLICASFLTRMLADITLTEAIAIAQAYDAEAEANQQASQQASQQANQRIADASSADAVMLIAIQIALNSRQLEPDQGQQFQRMLRQLDDQPDEEEVEQVADAARDLAKARHHIGQRRFNDSEKQLLRQYYYANQLLLTCLNSDGCLACA